MKKKIAVAACLVCAIVCGVIVSGMTSKASSANISIGVDNSTVKKEQEFTVKVNVSSDAAMQNIDTMLSYDPEVLEFVSSDSSAVAGASGMIHIMEEFLDPVGDITYNLTFKALEVGNSSLQVSETFISEAETFNVVPVSSDAVSMEVITNRQESTETRLGELLVAPGTMNETFDPDVYEYTVDVAYEDEAVAVSAIPMDENAVVTMEKADTLSFGANTIVITVTAPSGNVGTYTITVNRSDVPESQSETEESQSEPEESQSMSETVPPSDVPETQETSPESVDAGESTSQSTESVDNTADSTDGGAAMEDIPQTVSGNVQ